MVAHRVAVVALTVGFAYLSGGENGAEHEKAIRNLSLTIKGIDHLFVLGAILTAAQTHKANGASQSQWGPGVWDRGCQSNRDAPRAWGQLVPKLEAYLY